MQPDFNKFEECWSRILSIHSVSVTCCAVFWGKVKAVQEKGLWEKPRTSLESQGCRICHKCNNEYHCIVVNIAFVKISANWSLVRSTSSRKPSLNQLGAFAYRASNLGFVLSWSFGLMPHCLRKDMLRCDTIRQKWWMCKMLSSFLQRMTIACRQRSTRRKICPRNQSLRQVRDQCELSQPLQYTLRPSLLLIHKRAQGQ